MFCRLCLIAVTVLSVFAAPLRAAVKLPERAEELWLFDDIPGDQGMAYFYDVWDNYHAGGRMTVTDKIIAHYQSDSGREMPYKVLFTGRNYVLFAYQITFFNGEVWTKMGIFALLPDESWREEEGLRFLSCSIGREQTAEYFSWPNDKLIDQFMKHCGRIDPDTGYLTPPEGYGWSDLPYWRIKPKLLN